jgi:hypothetical protein
MQQRWWRRYRSVSLPRFLSDQVKTRRGIKRTGSHCESAANPTLNDLLGLIHGRQP